MESQQDCSKSFLGFEPESSPPSSNRGGKPGNDIDVGVDWLAFTMSGELYTNCWEIVSRYYPLELTVKDPVPCPGYRQVVEFQDGPKLSYSDDRPEIHIQFCGKIINFLNLGQQVSMIREFDRLGAKCTRIDLRLDDFRQIVTPAQMRDWANQGYLCRFRIWEPKERFSGTDSLGLTFCAGRRGQNGSGCYFRCYEWFFDKHGNKSNGRNITTGTIDSVRFECEFSQHKAAGVCSALASESGFSDTFQRVREIILGSIDFRSGTTEQSYRDRLRLPLWSSYVQGVFPCKFVRPKRVKSSDFRVEVFARQWGGKLAAFLQSGGFGVFSQALLFSIADGSSRGYGVALPAEKVVALKKCLLTVFPNLEHTRRYLALLPAS